MIRVHPVLLAVCILHGCASHLQTSSSLDQAAQTATVTSAQQHAEASDQKVARTDEKTSDAVQDARREGPVVRDEDDGWRITVAATPTKPARTIERIRHTHEERGATEATHNEQKQAQVKQASADESKSTTDATSATSSTASSTSKAKNDLSRTRRPSLGILASLLGWIWWIVGAAIAVLAIFKRDLVAGALKAALGPVGALLARFLGRAPPEGPSGTV